MNQKKSSIEISGRETIKAHQFCEALIKWYRENHRKLPWRETDDPYKIWVSEVMLQQTQVRTVLSYYNDFLDKFPDVRSLSQADLQEVLKAWEGMGYYARARHLHEASRIIVLEYGEKIPEDYEAFKKLPGVGNYIASAVMSIAFRKEYPALDGNVKRVLARLFLLDEPVHQEGSQIYFSENISMLLDKKQPGTFNQAMMELGAMICVPKEPLCPKCPVVKYCLAFRDNLQSKYPVKKPRKTVPTHYISVAVILKDNKILITRRKAQGLLGGLWEFPGGKVGKDETAEEACVREIWEEINLNIKKLLYLTTVKHAYTHFKINLDVFICQYHSGVVMLNGPVDYRWIDIGEIDKFPFPKANHKFIPQLKKVLT